MPSQKPSAPGEPSTQSLRRDLGYHAPAELLADPVFGRVGSRGTRPSALCLAGACLLSVSTVALGAYLVGLTTSPTPPATRPTTPPRFGIGSPRQALQEEMRRRFGVPVSASQGEGPEHQWDADAEPDSETEWERLEEARLRMVGSLRSPRPPKPETTVVEPIRVSRPVYVPPRVPAGPRSP